MDLGFLAIIIFSLSFSLLFSLAVYTSFYTNTIDLIQGDSELNQTKYDLENELSIINSRILFNFNFFDKITFMLFIVLFISTSYFALNLNTHPVYFIASIFTFIVVILIAWFIQQMYITAVGIDALTSAGNSLEYINLLMINLPMIIALLFIILAIIIYSNVGKGGLNFARNF